MKSLHKLIIMVLLAAQVAGGQETDRITKVGSTAAAFLEIEVGARANGMGGSFVAVADDATALYWNPAGITQLRAGEISLIHTDWLAGMNFDFGAVVIPMGAGNFVGLSLSALTMEEMDVRTIAEPEGTGEKFDASDIAVALTYARALTDRFSIGFNVKFISQRIWHMSATNLAIDVGTNFRTSFRDMKIGMSISNFGGDMQMLGRDVAVVHDIDETIDGNNPTISADLKTDEWALPLMFRVGIALNVVNTTSHRMTLATDAAHPNNNTESINTGVEYAFNESIFIRGGYRSLFQPDSEEGLTLGAGFIWSIRGLGRLKVDYAYADFGRFTSTQRFSLSIGL